MNRAVWLQDRRMQKFRDVLSRWERKVGLGATISALPAPLRGDRARGAGRPTAWQGAGPASAGGPGDVDAVGIPHPAHGLEREAAWVPLGLQVDQDAAACGRAGGPCARDVGRIPASGRASRAKA
jgi:hypothetical protein